MPIAGPERWPRFTRSPTGLSGRASAVAGAGRRRHPASRCARCYRRRARRIEPGEGACGIALGRAAVVPDRSMRSPGCRGASARPVGPVRTRAEGDARRGTSPLASARCTLAMVTQFASRATGARLDEDDRRRPAARLRHRASAATALEPAHDRLVGRDVRGGVHGRARVERRRARRADGRRRAGRAASSWMVDPRGRAHAGCAAGSATAGCRAASTAPPAPGILPVRRRARLAHRSGEG